MGDNNEDSITPLLDNPERYGYATGGKRSRKNNRKQKRGNNKTKKAGKKSRKSRRKTSTRRRR